MRTHTLTVNERELRIILTACDLARGETVYSDAWRRRFTTQYAKRLYERLRDL